MAVLNNVPPTALAAARFMCFTQASSADTNPTALDGRNAHHHGVVWDISCYHGAGRYKAIPAKRYTAEDCCVGPDRGSLPHESPLIFMLALDVAARIDHICKDHGRPTEH